MGGNGFAFHFKTKFYIGADDVWHVEIQILV